MFNVDDSRIAVVGLGYVGLPLALEFGRQFPTIGFDVNQRRILELRSGKDRSLEVDKSDLLSVERLGYADDPGQLAQCNVFVVTVPTPIDSHKRPDLEPLESASRMLGGAIRPGAVIIYESTVYPGATEEVCVPILESVSGLEFNDDFFVGYSPERINPGDKTHRVTSIAKVTSGSTPEAAEFIDNLYGRVIPAGTHRASSIRVAEAAKVIENTQRDVNIALINELALIFNLLEIDTQEVLEAAGTKWNFLPFRPGLVGGHCIGVDPYYLTHKAQEIGYHPEMILAGRRINDNMGQYVAHQVVRLMNRRGLALGNARILVLGLAFKENCPDLRNSKVVDVIREFQAMNAEVDVHDPWVDAEEAYETYGVTMVDVPGAGVYDTIVIAVAHEQFKSLGPDGLRAFGKENCVLFDIKYMLPVDAVDGRL